MEVSVLHLSVLSRFFYEKDTKVLPGHVKVSVLERRPSYGMSVLSGFTVQANIYENHLQKHEKLCIMNNITYVFFKKKFLNLVLSSAIAFPLNPPLE